VPANTAAIAAKKPEFEVLVAGCWDAAVLPLCVARQIFVRKMKEKNLPMCGCMTLCYVWDWHVLLVVAAGTAVAVIATAAVCCHHGHWSLLVLPGLLLPQDH
jgi:hypothetical protein